MIQLKLLTTTGCSHCEQAKRVIAKLQPEFPDLHVEIINLLEQPEQAVQYGILVSPAIVVNEQVVFVGGVKEEQLRERLRQVNAQR